MFVKDLLELPALVLTLALLRSALLGCSLLFPLQELLSCEGGRSCLLLHELLVTGHIVLLSELCAGCPLLGGTFCQGLLL